MKGHRAPILGLIGFVALFIIHWATAPGAAEPLPVPEEQAFRTHIDRTDPYTAWRHQSGCPHRCPAAVSHGYSPEISAKAVSVDAIEAGRLDATPDGPIPVKVNYGRNGDPVCIPPMPKVQGHSPARGDWFRAAYHPDGKAGAAGKVDFCIQCRLRAESGFMYLAQKPD